MSSTDPSSHAGDTSAPSSPVSAPSQAPPGPPTHDTFVRPFTSHGGPTYPPPSASAYYPPNPYPSERPFTSHGTASPFPPPAFPGGPYLSASARTSFTRVDVDSVGGIGGVGMYPVLPMPSIPTGLSTRNADDHADAMATPLDAEANAASNVDPGDIAGSGTEGMESQVPQTPQVSLTFLLVSGRRRTMSFEPQITVGRVKELVWNAWPGDWQDERPPAPSYLRILYLGKILQDEDTLAHLSFPTSLPSSTPASPTIVHLSIRSFAPPSEDPSLSKKRRLSTALGSSFTAGRRASLRRPRRGTSETEVPGAGGTTEDEHAGCCAGCVVC